MSELAPEGPGGGGGKKLFGLPRNVVIAFGLAAGGTILYLWWKNRGNAAAADGTNAAGSGQQQFTTQGIDYSGELAVMQSELEDILQATGSSQGAGTQSGGGGSWDGGGSYGGSGGYGSGGSWDAGTGQGTDSGAGTGQNGAGTGSTSTGSTSTGSTGAASSGTPKTSPATISASVSGSKVVLSGSAVGGATGYEWQVALPSGSLWHDSKTTVPSATYSPVPTTGTYHYKVRATNAAGAGPWSAVKTFTVTK